ncbi:NAD-dependent epimerase/dehydratase family protein [Pseudoalteromonas sp. SA25]|uniref:NAD-dependent epimerase/dehydratase family protein n=1 Tax=Pseudoalteromonas sp. SA25 TaxID=2686347 RepID=UPI0013FE47CC|nr:NAD-dependent epimerase/dehydratase family protein [Pseudoalteromonas sp. SA25]
MQKILLTGSTGFIGTALNASFLTLTEFDVRKLIRKKNFKSNSHNCIDVGELTGETDYYAALQNIDVVVHLAAIAHDKHELSANTFEKYKVCNIDATLSLARQAASLGVKRFVFLSSIGVNGVNNDSCFTCFDEEHPTDDYAKSKYNAELGLKKIAEETGIEVVVIRPPLVYGKNAPGNFGALLKIAKKNPPLPFGKINNQRSFVALDNLIDLIITCINHPNAANQTFLVSDDMNISTSNLLKKLILAAGNKPCLLPVPVCFLKLIATIVGRKAAIEKLSNSLTVDIEYTKKTLNWKPPITLDEGICRCFK